MDALAALRLQIEWGADEALAEAPVDRFVTTGARAAEVVRPAATAPAAARPRPRAAAVAPPAAPALRAQEIANVCHTREELRAALSAFGGCPLSATATNLVFADGNPDSGLMLIGEGPGAEEDRAGLPFVGPSGQFLDRMVASIGLTRNHYLITNLIPWRPPGNRNPTESEIAVCLPFLLRHIALVRPRRIVLLGNIPAQAVTGIKTGITRLRGKWLPVTIPGLDAPIPALPMLHPAFLQRTHGAKRDAWADMIALRQSLDAEP